MQIRNHLRMFECHESVTDIDTNNHSILRSGSPVRGKIIYVCATVFHFTNQFVLYIHL